ncbi:MAG: glycolate oxidase FAD binding subunit [Planctomycetota bacterium]|jgi:glycolate oxidase FAD binding subunit
MSRPLVNQLADILPAHSIDHWNDGHGLASPRVAPEEEAQFQEVMRLAGREGLRVLPLGKGSKLGWLPRPERVDLVLSTLAYRGVVSYEPADGTVTARAGTPMGDLAAVVSEGGHHLSPAVPKADGSTLGGVVAAGQSGDDRMRYGALRNNLLGTRVVLADGSAVKSGGQLVKNVTGYDLHRAFCGSFGSLCVVLEASLRLHPLPEDRALCKAHFSSRGEALEMAAAIRRSPVRPVTTLVHDLTPSAVQQPWTLMVLLAGNPQVIGFEAQELLALCPDAAIARGSGVNAITKQIRDIELVNGRWPSLSIESQPSTLNEVIGDVRQAAADCGYGLKLLIHPAVARTIVWLSPSGDAEASAALEDPMAVAAFDERLAQLPLVARWRDLPPAVAKVVSPAGRPGPTLDTMREITQALDPRGVLAPRLFPA